MSSRPTGMNALFGAVMAWGRSNAVLGWCRGTHRVGRHSGQARRPNSRRSLRLRVGWDLVPTVQRLALVALVVALGCLMVSAPPASATFPGRNGLIVFDTQDRPGIDGGSSQIYTVKPDGSNLRQLTHLGAGHNAFDPHWSPDGHWVAYVSDIAGGPAVWVMRADGTGNHQLVSDPGYDHFSPSWSPDGQRLVFSRCSQFLRTCALAVVRSDGAGLRVLVGGNWNFGQPVWSPDGRWLAYTSDKGASTPGCGSPARTAMPRTRSPPLVWSPTGRLGHRTAPRSRSPVTRSTASCSRSTATVPGNGP